MDDDGVRKVKEGNKTLTIGDVKKDIEQKVEKMPTMDELEAIADEVKVKAKAEAEKVVEEVVNYTWADLEAAGVKCPTSDGTIPGHHAFMWHGPTTPQAIINEMAALFLNKM